MAGLLLQTDGLSAEHWRVVDLLFAAHDATRGLAVLYRPAAEVTARLEKRMSEFGELDPLAPAVAADVAGDALPEDLVPPALLEQIRWATGVIRSSSPHRARNYLPLASTRGNATPICA